MKVLVTGGAGYIGTHTCVELLHANHEVVVYDNFSNSRKEAIRRVEQITGKRVYFIEADIRDESALKSAIDIHDCQSVIHFAALKAVGESVKVPLDYYDNNVHGTLCLLRAMAACNVKRFVFSSSATVYGEPQWLPLTESHPLSATNPYGRTKLIIEDVLRDLFRADPSWSIAMLRYFNPVGAHESGLIGEDPQGIPNNLMPFIAQVAVGRREKLQVWGTDYSTPDGTGVRDYIHVVDLALGHLKAIEALQEPRCDAINLGAGIGYSVLEVVRAFERASGRTIPFEPSPRRSGDIAACYADAAFAKATLDWAAQRDLHAMCKSHWAWQSMNPQGYI